MSAGSHSAISVIVITLNEEDNIRGCLDSLMALEYPRESLEIVVVDASSDATPEIVAEYPSVRLIRSEKGFSRQKNAGLAAISHGLVAFTDADCRVEPDWLLVVDREMRDQGVAGLGGNGFPPPGTGFFGRCVAAVGHPAGGSLGFDANITPSADGIEFAAGCNCAFRADAIRAVGGYSSAFERGGEDVDMSRRLRAAGHRLVYAEDCTVYHIPRGAFAEYASWNVRVGYSKYRLSRPSPLRLLLEPSFPLWSGLVAFGLAWLAYSRPELLFPIAAFGWLAFLGLVYVGSKPYRLCFRRRDRVKLPLIALLTLVPALVYVRQVGINIGQWQERLRV